MIPNTLKRRPTVIIGLLLLTVMSLVTPPAVPLIGIVAAIILCAVILEKTRKKPGLTPHVNREPMLWDDGFGAT